MLHLAHHKSGENMKPVKLVKTVLRMISAALVVGLAFWGCDNQNNYVNDAMKPLLLCFGDSLTAGYGASEPDRDDPAKAYPAFLQTKVTIEVINAGVSGHTSTQGLARVDQDVLSRKPQIVIIEFGANDILPVLAQGTGSLPQRAAAAIATTKSNLQSIITKLDNGKRQIYIAKFYNEEVVDALLTWAAISDATVRELFISSYDAMFASLLESRGSNVQLIDDIWSGVWGINMSVAPSPDIPDIHPNAAGYEIMARKYFDAMEPYLKAHNLVK
jgi:lysophospholipase L1-like esterase